MADSVLTTTDSEIDQALARARDFADEPYLVKVVYRPEPELNLLILTLDNGERLLVPCEDLPELKGATPEQIADFTIEPRGSHIWWHQIDDGVYFPEFLEFRWGNKGLVDRRDGGDRYRIDGLE
jgi:hypothetical protein